MEALRLMDAHHAETLDAELRTKAQERSKEVLEGLLDRLSDLGFSWRDIARVVGVSVPSGADAVAQAAGLFADARAMQATALVRLADDDIRDAAENAWCATLRATDGLIVGRTGQAPRKSTATTRMLRSLVGSDPEITALMRSYFTSQSTLHDDCFHLSMCEPLDHTEHLIRETIDYIAEAERLAEAVAGAPRSEP